MTDSDIARRGGKRERLVAAAGDLLHRQGVQATKLAEIADAAAVPPGNVYYYFKTKDDLVRAVIDARSGEFAAMVGSLERLASPAERLKALARSWSDMRDLIARYGCPLGTLTSELGKNEDGLDRDAAKPLSLLLDWAEGQFREMSQPDARELAVTLLAGVQGASLLANAFRDPGIMSSQVRHLEQWIDSLD
jgi:TetR/AcrR family transcriptional repressor of nem operon